MTEHSASAQLAQSISALSDNEASELELARILKASETDPEVGATWHRYHVARAAMKGELDTYVQADAASSFSARVSAALDDEPAYTASRPATRWWQNAGRFAVAASVAGAVVIGAQLYQDQSIEAPVMATTEEAPAASVAEVSLPMGFNAPALSVRPVSAQMNYEAPRRPVVFESRQADTHVSNEQIRFYLNQLVESHTNHAAVNGAQGMLPFARNPLSEEE